jgi:hypothetical protein
MPIPISKTQANYKTPLLLHLDLLSNSTTSCCFLETITMEGDMRKTTIRKYLNTSQAHPNLRLASRLGRASSAVTLHSHIRPNPIDNTHTWIGFTIENVNNKYGHVLDTEVTLPEFPPICPQQEHVRNERSFESILTAHNCRIVNEALKKGAELLGWKSSQIPTWLSGAYFDLGDRNMNPDWGGMKGEIDEKTTPDCIIPGDTKYFSRELVFKVNDQIPSPPSSPSVMQRNNNRGILVTDDSGNLTSGREAHISLPLPSSPLSQSESTSFFPSSPPSDNDSASENDAEILEQPNNYAKVCNTRYCYLLTPVEAVLILRYSDDDTDGYVKTSRQPSSRHQQQPLTSLHSLNPMSSPQQSSSSYIPSDPSRGPEQSGIFVRSVMWDAVMKFKENEDGKDLLSYNMAIWVLHMLAAEESEVKPKYPEIWENEQ